jgi:hypothetical protein
MPIKLKHIKKDNGPPDYLYIMPNKDRIDIAVQRSPKGNKYTCALPQPHGITTFLKMKDLRNYLYENFEKM